MGSYLSTVKTLDSSNSMDLKNKQPIMIAKISAPTSSILGWTYCLIYPANEDGVHHIESGNMGVLYRSSLVHEESHYLKYMNKENIYNIYKPTMQGFRTERVKFTPLTEKEQAYMEKVRKNEAEYI